MTQHPQAAARGKNLLILHFTVFIWGFTGILGQLISIQAVPLVWYRVLIAAVTLFVYFKVSGVGYKVKGKAMLHMLGTGGIVGLHWVLFFLSIKLSTVPVALVCLSSVTLFTALFDPLINRRRISRLQLVAGALIIAGISVIFTFEGRYTWGIVAGLGSAVAASLFSIINSKLVRNATPQVIAFYEMGGAFVWISLYLAGTGGYNRGLYLPPADVVYLLLLGTVCTAAAYVAGVSVMRTLSPFTVALVTNLEPVYGILLAFALLGDANKMTPGFWVGSVLILCTIFLFPVTERRIAAYRSR